MKSKPEPAFVDPDPPDPPWWNASVAAWRALMGPGSVPMPINILQASTPVALPLDDVPPVLANLAAAQSRVVGTDPSMTVLAGLGVAAAVLDDRVRVEVTDGFAEFARLWVVLVGEPSSQKTPAINNVLAPALTIQDQMLDDWELFHEPGVTDSKKISPPPPPRLIVNDTTIEALAERLAENPRGLLYTSSELQEWLNSFNQYNKGRDRQFWLQMYDSQPFIVDRKSAEKKMLRVAGTGVSLVSAITPAGLGHALKQKQLIDDGLPQRMVFLVCGRPAKVTEAASKGTFSNERAAWDAAIRRLYAQPPATMRMTDDAYSAYFAERQKFIDLQEHHDTARSSYSGHLGKRGSMVLRVALLFHFLQGSDTTSPIQADTMHRAVRFMRRQERHAEHVFDLISGDGVGALPLARSVAEWILYKGPLLTEVNQKTISGCKAWRGRSKQDKEAAITYLCDTGWLAPLNLNTTHGARWAVNFIVHNSYAKQAETIKRRNQLVWERIKEQE